MLLYTLGSYFACSTHALAVNVIGKRVVNTEKNNPSFMYYVNDGVYGSFLTFMLLAQCRRAPDMLEVR